MSALLWLYWIALPVFAFKEDWRLGIAVTTVELILVGMGGGFAGLLPDHVPRRERERRKARAIEQTTPDPCPHCGRQLKTVRGLRQHIGAKHASALAT